jgi:hypothetical protein
MLTHGSRRNKEQKQDDVLTFALFVLLLSAALISREKKGRKNRPTSPEMFAKCALFPCISAI